MDIKTKFEAKFNQIQKAEDIIEFLKELSKDEKKTLVPLIKKLHRYYSEIIKISEKGYGTWAARGNPKQHGILNYAGYFCMNQKDFSKTFWGFRNEYFYNPELHDIYSPTWFNNYVNHANSGSSLNYHLLIKLYQAGYLKPSPSLIVRHLPSTISKRRLVNNRNRDYYQLDNLFLDSITLKEHIWYLFSEESSINWSDRWISSKDSNGSWKTAFSELIESGDLDRIRVLKECLKCSTRNYNKTLTGWFFDLLLYLQPDTKELLLLQEDLFLVFNSPHSKPINVCLKYIKTICTNDQFDATLFLDNIPILLSSETKAIINNSLMILDKIAKTNKHLQASICELTTEAFIHKDEKIQTRAAKLLNKYGDENSEILCQNIGMYHTELFSSVKQLLNQFELEQVLADEGLEENIHYENESKINENNKIKKIETFEEMIFFFAQIFDNNEDYHFDLFLELLPRFYQMTDENNFNQLEPIFLRATKSISNWDTKTGYLENYMAVTFSNIMSLFIKKYPNHKKINTLYQEISDKEIYVYNVDGKNVYAPLLDLIENRKVGNNYIPFTQRLAFSRILCEQNLTLPFLGTPTHRPCWIAMETLIEKLKIYQTQNQAVHLYDFQIAISRVVLENNYNAIIQANLKGEYRDLLLYLTDATILELTKCKHPSFWLAAIYRKGNPEELNLFLEEFDKDNLSHFMLDKAKWVCRTEARETTVWNYQKRENEKKIVQDKSLIILEKKPKKKTSASFLKKIFSKKKQMFSIYHCFKESDRNTYIRPHDAKKMLFLSPFNPDLILRLNIMQSLKNIDWTDADLEKILIHFTEGLTHIWDDFGEMTYLQMACTFLYNKKTCRQFAAELWVQAVSQNKMNHELLGTCIGKLEYNEYAPIKRWTDLVNDQMMNISKEHNKALEALMIQIIMELNVKPIKGTNKLLELYAELVQRNKSEFPDDLKSKVKTWESSKSLLRNLRKMGMVD